jgi:acyl CoA:acetate/3-ketoacid CoA transferase beta subunit
LNGKDLIARRIARELKDGFYVAVAAHVAIAIELNTKDGSFMIVEIHTAHHVRVYHSS